MRLQEKPDEQNVELRQVEASKKLYTRMSSLLAKALENASPPPAHALILLL